MNGSVYLAWRYVCYYRLTTAVLVASITLIIFLPAALQVIVHNAEQHFRARAESTPLVVGARGSRLELILASVYFDRPHEDIIRFGQLQQIEQEELGRAIGLHTRFATRDCPIVGTTADYLNFRDLRIARGRTAKMLGECVVGSRVAQRLGVDVGSKIPVSAATAFVLDNAPLRLNVVGILAATETPDDEAIFVSLETTWIIEDLGHGHASDAEHGSTQASHNTDITSDNVASFHFHGDRATFPITAIIVVPNDERAQDLLRGKFVSPGATAQIVVPRIVMKSLLEKVIMVRSYLIAIIAIVSLITVLMMALVVALSIRLRRAEMVTMSKIGCSRFKIASILGSQVAIILAVSAAVATILALITHAYGPELVRMLIL